MEASRDHERRRQRRYWIWMGLMPGMLMVLGVWMIIFLGDKRMQPLQTIFTIVFYGLIVWIGYCAVRLVKTRREVSMPEGIGLSVGIFVLMALANAAEFCVLFWTSCIVVGGLSSL